MNRTLKILNTWLTMKSWILFAGSAIVEPYRPDSGWSTRIASVLTTASRTSCSCRRSSLPVGASITRSTPRPRPRPPTTELPLPPPTTPTGCSPTSPWSTWSSTTTTSIAIERRTSAGPLPTIESKASTGSPSSSYLPSLWMNTPKRRPSWGTTIATARSSRRRTTASAITSAATRLALESRGSFVIFPYVAVVR